MICSFCGNRAKDCVCTMPTNPPTPCFECSTWLIKQDLIKLNQKPKEMVNHPSHYNAGEIEVIDIIDDWELDWYEGNIIKYVMRSRFKGNRIQDLTKGKWYLDRYLDIVKSKNDNKPVTKKMSDENKIKEIEDFIKDMTDEEINEYLKKRVNSNQINEIVSKYIDNDPDGKAGYLEDMKLIKKLTEN